MLACCRQLLTLPTMTAVQYGSIAADTLALTRAPGQENAQQCTSAMKDSQVPKRQSFDMTCCECWQCLEGYAGA
jgi:hypothetical protein